MRHLILDYAHGYVAGRPTGQVVVQKWTDGLRFHEEDALLRIGQILERRLTGELGLVPGRSLVLTRPDANDVARHHRMLVVNQYATDPDTKLISLHAHTMEPALNGSRIRIIRPAAGPRPDPRKGMSPAEAAVLQFWRDVADVDGFGTMVGAKAVTFARQLAGGLDRHRTPSLPRALTEWIRGAHLDGAARDLFELSLVPAIVVELALGTTEEEVRKTLDKSALLVEELYRGLESAVGWGT